MSSATTVRRAPTTPNGTPTKKRPISPDSSSIDDDIGVTQENLGPIWRLDPEESFSDFEIEVTSRLTGMACTYHVHKMQLVFGPNRSSYFAGLFRNGRFVDSTGKSRINLEEEAANVFPDFLDYVYTGDFSKESLSPDEAVALYHLGNYFGVESLEAKCRIHVSMDFQLDKLEAYLPPILVFRDSKLVQVARNRVMQAIFSQDSRLTVFLQLMDVDFLKKVLFRCAQLIEARNRFCQTDGAFLSKIVYEYIRCHEEEIDKQCVKELLKKECIPMVDPVVALHLLELEATFVRREDHHVSCLQKRCIESLAKITMTDSQKQDALRVYEMLTAPNLACLLLHTTNGDNQCAANPDSGAHQIEVFGTVVSACGVYHQYEGTGAPHPSLGEVEDCDWYWKHGVFNGKEVTFAIVKRYEVWTFLLLHEESRKSTELFRHETICESKTEEELESADETHEEAQSHDSVDSNKNRGYDVPPAWGWRSASNNAKTPPPFLLFRPAVDRGRC